MRSGYKLKENDAESILERAKSQFKERYLSGLSEWINLELSRDFSEKSIDDALCGKESDFHLVIALCEYANINWREAFLSPYSASPLVRDMSASQEVPNIQSLVDSICEKVWFSFEDEIHSFMRQPFGVWLMNSFVTLDLIKVRVLPSQYPIFERDFEREYLRRRRLDSDDSSSDDSSSDDSSSDDSSSDDSSSHHFRHLDLHSLYGEGRTDSRKILEEEGNLFVYGDPGSGKSSYLKWLALQCKSRTVLPEYVPLFLEMRHFPILGAGTTLTTHFLEDFEKLGVKRIELEKVLDSGKGVFILDGIDEIRRSEQDRIFNLIRRLLRDYNKCLFVFSSRLGFNLTFPGFRRVIVSPFRSSKQIPNFVNEWFGSTELGRHKAGRMLEKLKSRQYRGISEISRRPVLLKLLCFIFEEYDDFPVKRADVFQRGIDELVRQSHSSISAVETGIKGLPELTSRDITNILCRLAKHFFVDLDGDILFNRREVQRIVEEYIDEVYGPSTIDADHIIKLIEEHNGLLVSWGKAYCSFSHLTYQEYFVARSLVDQGQQELIYEHITNPRWKFIIGLVAELLPQDKASHFFHGFKYRLDSIVNIDKSISSLLGEIDGESLRAASHGSSSAAPEDDSPSSFTAVLTRAWYVVYAIGKYTSKVNGALPSIKSRILPDMIYAVSMVTNHTLETHASLYNLYHCIAGEDPRRFVVLVGESINFFQSTEERTFKILDSWKEQIHNQMDRFGDNIQLWWNDRYIRKRWRERIIEVMRMWDVPCPSALGESQISLLEEYYTATHLFSICLNRSEIDQSGKQAFSNTMLLIEHFPPDNGDNDFIGF